MGSYASVKSVGASTRRAGTARTARCRGPPSGPAPTARTADAPERGDMTFVDEVKNAVTPRAALLVIGVLALQLLFITSYVGALHKPKPTDVAFGVVAP